mmetsp:Transcript_17182/g.26790  ORF Transcript_17182/g.26790 Transcript_17182/m.26790 type:complete len:124 (+) Transcript_17182:31-402(+)
MGWLTSSWPQGGWLGGAKPGEEIGDPRYSMYANQAAEHIAAAHANQLEPSLDYQPGGDQAVFELSPTTMYILVAVLVALLVMNFVILSYNLCCASQRRKVRYQKVSKIVSSDDDMQNLKEVNV